MPLKTQTITQHVQLRRIAFVFGQINRTLKCTLICPMLDVRRRVPDQVIGVFIHKAIRLLVRQHKMFACISMTPLEGI